MRTIFRSTLVLSGSSMVAIIAGLMVTKARAVLLGPDGMALSTLLQAIVNLSVLVAALGVGTGIVRTVAAALARDDQVTVAATRWAAWRLRLLLAVLILPVLGMFRSPISGLVLGSEHESTNLLIASGAIGFALVTDLQSSVLNAYHRVGALATLGIANAVLGSVAAIAIIAIAGRRGIAPAILATSAVAFAVSAYLLHTQVPAGTSPINGAVRRAATKSLLHFGVPYTGSALIGTGVQLAMPVLVLHMLGASSVGYYQAAALVAGTYLTLLITAMSQDYYPRVSAASLEKARLVEMINNQQRLVMTVALPMILLLTAGAPYLIPLAYTNAFRPAAAILQWQLIGDLFRFSSWTLAFVVLARSGARKYFVIELFGGALYLVTSWGGAMLWGLPGLGVSWLASYAAYFTLTWIMVRRDTGLTWTVENRQMMKRAGLAMFLVGGASLSGNEPLRLGVTCACGALATLGSVRALQRDLGKSVAAPRLKSLLVSVGIVRRPT